MRATKRAIEGTVCVCARVLRDVDIPLQIFKNEIPLGINKQYHVARAFERSTAGIILQACC